MSYPGTTLRERGAATVEYMAVLLILGACLAVGGTYGLSGKGPGALVGTVQYGICQGMQTAVGKLGIKVDAGCKPYQDHSTSPRCVTYQQDRLLGINAAFRFIRGEVNGRDTIVSYVDPATGDEQALVFLSNDVGAGVEAAKNKSGFKVNAKAVANLGTGVVYHFDSRKEAQDFLDARRGNIFTRALGVLTGGKAGALFDGIRKGWDWLTGQEDHGPTPMGVTAELSLQGEAGASGQKKVGGVVGIGGEAQAKGKASGQIRYNFDGTSQLDVRFDGSVTGEAGLKADSHLPVLGDLNFMPGHTWNGTVAYRIRFDKHGNPKQLVFISEHGTSNSLKLGPDAANGKGSDGSLTRHTYTLDLTDPSNRAAFDKAFPAGGYGPINPVSFLGDNSLLQRLSNNSVQLKMTYDTQGNQLAATAPDDNTEHGLKIKGVGIGANDDTARRTLKKAWIKTPGGDWHVASKCTKHGS